MKLSVLIPVYNEENTILKILQRIEETKAGNVSYEIIVINDGSTDNTKKILEENSQYYSKLINSPSNRGKGYAIKEGIKVSSGEYIIFQDADLEYDPSEFKKFIKISQEFNADAIIGSRFVYSEYTRSHNYFNKIGNGILTFIFNILYNTTFTDIYSCYLCYRRSLINFEDLVTEGFDQHAEILCKVVKRGKKFYETPISYNGRAYDEGKKIKFYHFFSVVYRIFLERIK